MGYDIVAYMDIDQDDIEKYITDNTIDREDLHNSKVIEYYLDKYVEKETDRDYLRKWKIYYYWDDEFGLHKIEAYHPSNFIRDDDRLSNKYLIKNLERKTGKPYPYILEDMNIYIREPADAEEAAVALLDFFPEDMGLMHFRTWLLITAKYALCYELSW